MTHPMPATAINSSVEYTLGVLEDRLDFAEEETQKLTKQLVAYGFQRLPAEKPEENSPNEKCKSFKSFIDNINNENYRSVVSRLCQTESVIESMKNGMKSIQDENSISKVQLMKEKSKIQECYSKEIEFLSNELENCKSQLSSHDTVKSSLENQIEKLKKEISKKIDTQRNLTSKIREKDLELNAFQEKLSQLTKESGKQQINQRKFEKMHSSLLFKISELEQIVETEKNNVSKLNQKCESLTNDAVLARQEFEKEFDNRLQFENLLTVQEEDFKSSNRKMEDLLSQMKSLKSQNENKREKLKVLTKENAKLNEALVTVGSDNKKIKESLKKAVTDKNALIEKEKESVLQEKCRVKSLLAQQNKVLDATKDTFIGELDKQCKQTETIQNENLKLGAELHETKVKLGEFEFKIRLMQQNHEGEMKHLHNAISSEKKMKDEAFQQIKHFENDINDRSAENKTLFEQCSCLRKELNTANENYLVLESEHVKISEKLLWTTVSKESSEQMKQKMTDMVSEKNKLAYEKGVLETKVSQLEEEMETLIKMKNKYDEASSRCLQFENELKLAGKESKKALEENRMKDREIKSMNLELNAVKEKISQAKLDYNDIEKKNAELTEDLKRHQFGSEEITWKYESELKMLKNRVCSNTKEQQNASEHFKNLMSTNDQLQSELQKLQESLGRKDFQLRNLSIEREKNVEVMGEMQNDLVLLNKKLDMMEETNKDEILEMQNKLKNFEEENARFKKSNAEMKNELKIAKSKLTKAESRLKEKEGNLKAHIESTDQQTQSQQLQHDKNVKDLSKTHRKEVEKFKKELQQMKESYQEKEDDFEERFRQLNTLDKKLKGLHEEKKIYIEKNTTQAELLEAFMKQISGLQGELSTIAEEQNTTTSLLKEKDNHIRDEKRKRKDMEQKYKVMLRKKAIDELQRLKPKLSIFQTNQTNEKSSCVERNLLEEKLETQDAVKKYQKTLEKEERKVRKLEEDVYHLHRAQNKKLL